MTNFDKFCEDVLAIESMGNRKERKSLLEELGNERVISDIINHMASAGVKFADKEDTLAYFKSDNQARALGMAMAFGFGVGRVYDVYKIGPAYIGCIPNLKKCQSIWVCVYNKNGKCRGYELSRGRIMKMYDKDTKQIDANMVKKYAKFIMKHAQSSDSEAPVSRMSGMEGIVDAMYAGEDYETAMESIDVAIESSIRETFAKMKDKFAKKHSASNTPNSEETVKAMMELGKEIQDYIRKVVSKCSPEVQDCVKFYDFPSMSKDKTACDIAIIHYQGYRYDSDNTCPYKDLSFDEMFKKEVDLAGYLEKKAGFKDAVAKFNAKAKKIDPKCRVEIWSEDLVSLQILCY